MTATITTAAELYSCNSDMKALIKVWVDERRCPLPLVDLLLENGLESQAEAARWAATEKNQEMMWSKKKCGPYPMLLKNPMNDEKNYHYWNNRGLHQFTHDTPKGKVIYENQYQNETVEQAILWLLDNWVK